MEALGADDPRQVGPFRILGRLGRGSVGEVFLGRSPGGRPVAVKVVLPGPAGDATFRRRFRAEVDAARRVQGLHTAPVVDADLDAARPWLATAYVPGPSLREAVSAHGPLPAGTVAALCAGLAEGLSAVHRAGLVHGDVKPGNVLLASGGPHIVDFGIARAIEDAGTLASVRIGDPGFTAPEQIRGEEPGPAADVFSLGCVLAYAATGRHPFGVGTPTEVVHRMAHGEPDLAGVPEPLAGTIRACLAKDPAGRPAPAALLQAAPAPVPWLPPAVAAMAEQRERPLAAGGGTRLWRRRGLLAAVGAAAVVAVAAATAVVLSSGSGDDPAAAAAGGAKNGARLDPVASIETGTAESLRDVAYSPDGAYLVGVFRERGLVVWDANTRAQVTTLSAGEGVLPKSVAVSGNGLVAMGYMVPMQMTSHGLETGRGGAKVWDLRSGRTVADLTFKSSDRTDLFVMEGLAFSPDGRYLAGSGSGRGEGFGKVPLWDVKAGKLLKTFVLDGPNAGTTAAVQSVAFSPDGKTLAAGYGDGDLGGGVALFDVASRSPAGTLPLDKADAFGVGGLGFTPDGGTLTGSFGGVGVWDVAARKAGPALAGAESGFQSMALSPDGTTLAAGRGAREGGGGVTLWDMSSKKRLLSVDMGRGGVGGVAFAKDGATLATATDDARLKDVIKIWKLHR
ncbi:WD40 repeat domain-containing serine/threonine protein kinase [Actinomadura sp. WMMA1423]|uniref:WD40 repeat domain-containing serine/threonine protein kinase n=1 Tax=Actinomadura sp. WMMA1423 TaxID=2591108 RepID=UPI00143D8B96|nr:serine/threonine-protein kinase [Actinomadura sp. WMMA1423]